MTAVESEAALTESIRVPPTNDGPPRPRGALDGDGLVVLRRSPFGLADVGASAMAGGDDDHSDMIMTVRGPNAACRLGLTLTHEHLLCDVRFAFDPVDEIELASQAEDRVDLTYSHLLRFVIPRLRQRGIADEASTRSCARAHGGS